MVFQLWFPQLDFKISTTIKFSTCSSSCSTTNMPCYCSPTVVFHFRITEASQWSLWKKLEPQHAWASQWESHIGLLIWGSTSCRLRRTDDCVDVNTELYIQYWMNSDYMLLKMQFPSGWAGYQKTQIPFLTWITLGKSDQLHVLVVSRAWQGALFCCYAALKQNSTRPGSASAELQLLRLSGSEYRHLTAVSRRT